MRSIRSIVATGAGASVIAAGAAQAQPASDQTIQSPGTPAAEASYPPAPPDEGARGQGTEHLRTPFGTGVTLGGGVTGFTAENARALSSTGGGWNARLTLGTRLPIAAEIAYVGTTQDLQALGLDRSAYLISNGAEVAARFNILPGPIAPYVLSGAGLTHYRVMNDDFKASSIDDGDDVVYFPLGAGVALHVGALLLDARGTFRPAVDGELFGNGDANEMHTWQGNLAAGMEF